MRGHLKLPQRVTYNVRHNLRQDTILSHGHHLYGLVRVEIYLTKKLSLLRACQIKVLFICLPEIKNKTISPDFPKSITMK
jgi:hypothetical protein